MAVIPRKKKIGEIDRTLLVEPVLSADDWRVYEEGWLLFNDREFWKAHEKWETIWKRHPEESRIFFQGIIQLAAAYHLLLVKKRYGGMRSNFQKAAEKLSIFPSPFLRVDVKRLLSAIELATTEVDRIGTAQLDRFDVNLIPSVRFTR